MVCKQNTGGQQVGQPGACLFSKRLERGRFVWPAVKEGKINLTAAQLAMLLEGIDWAHSSAQMVTSTNMVIH